MFDLEAGDDLDLVVQTARMWAEKELAPSMREAEASRSVPPDLVSRWHEVGLGGLEVPVALDGAGLGCLARILVNEELAAGDVGQTLALDTLGPVLSAAFEVGGERAAADILAATDHGQRRAILVMEEDAEVKVTDGRLSLNAPWVPAEAAAIVAVLRSDSMVVVTSGFEFEVVRGAGLRAAGGARLTARSAPIEFCWSIDSGNPSGMGRARARVRLYYASLLLGVMRSACEFSAEYAQQREAFGKPIGHHQALAFLITDMRMALDAARWVVHEAAWRIDRGLPCSIEAASAWAECIDVSRTIGPNGVQILGGHGFMADYPVEKHMREARALGLLCGGFDVAIEEAGRGLIESNTPLALGENGAL